MIDADLRIAMDQKTLRAYDLAPQDYVKDWLSQPIPVEMHSIARNFFTRGAPTADIGSGSGRDTHWLNENGYPCTGFDASYGLLNEARARFPECPFQFALLPELAEIGDGRYQNVLCETVIMHLPRTVCMEAVKNLLRITSSGGVLSVSWRHPLKPHEAREPDGRLYEFVDADEILKIANSLKAPCVHRATIVNLKSQKKIDQIVLRKKQDAL